MLHMLMANWFMNRLVIRREIDMLVPESYEFDVRSTWHTILDQCFSSAGYEFGSPDTILFEK